MKNEAKLYVDLGAGRCAQVRVSIVEEAMPGPHEGCTFREPSFSELEAVTEKLWADPLQSQPPFEIERPTWHKPMHDAVPIPTAPSAQGVARTAKPWWAKILNRFP